MSVEELQAEVRSLLAENKAMAAQLRELEAKLVTLRKMALQANGASMRTSCAANAIVQFIDGNIEEVSR